PRAPVLILLGLLLLWPGISAAVNTHGAANQQSEMQAWFGDFHAPLILPGSCAPATASGLSLTAFACKAYVRGAASDLVYVDQAAATVGPFNLGNGAYWVAVHRSTSAAVSGWTRQGTTHYLWKSAPSSPGDAPEGLLLAQVTVSGGAITAIALVTAPTTPATKTLRTVADFITGGTGTQADPWVGWDSVCTNAYRVVIAFGAGHFKTSTPCTITTGEVTVTGSNAGTSIIWWQPTAATPGDNVAAIGASGVKTWLTIGSPTVQSLFVVVKDLTIASTDTTFAKRGVHGIDLRGALIAHLNNVSSAPSWHDTSATSIAFHLEGRGQNLLQHLYFSADWPMILDGTPNEGGDCYAATPGLCEFDTSTVTDISLEVTRGYDG